MSTYLFIGKNRTGKTRQLRDVIIPDLKNEDFTVFIHDSKKEYQNINGVYRVDGENGTEWLTLIDTMIEEQPFSALILDNFTSLPEVLRTSISEQLHKVRQSSTCHIWIVVNTFNEITIPVSAFHYISDFGVESCEDKEIIRDFYAKSNIPNFSYIGGKR